MVISLFGITTIFYYRVFTSSTIDSSCSSISFTCSLVALLSSGFVIFSSVSLH